MIFMNFHRWPDQHLFTNSKALNETHLRVKQRKKQTNKHAHQQTHFKIHSLKIIIEWTNINVTLLHILNPFNPVQKFA